MPDEKISALPAVTTVATGDLGVVVATGVTSKITQQQQINALVSFITAIVNIGGGKIILNPLGNASLANGGFTVDVAGNEVANSLSLAASKFVVSVAGVPTTVSGIPAAGIGVPVIVATAVVSASASSGPTLLYQLPATSGIFRLSGYLQIILGDGVAGTVDVTGNYTDLSGAGMVDLSGTQSINVIASFPCTGQNSGGNVFFCQVGDAITYTVTVTGGSGSATTQLNLVLEQLA